MKRGFDGFDFGEDLLGDGEYDDLVQESIEIMEKNLEDCEEWIGQSVAESGRYTGFSTFKEILDVIEEVDNPFTVAVVYAEAVFESLHDLAFVWEHTSAAVNDFVNNGYPQSNSSDLYNRQFEQYAKACAADSSSDSCRNYIDYCANHSGANGCEPLEESEEQPPESSPEPSPESSTRSFLLASLRPPNEAASCETDECVDRCTAMKLWWDWFKYTCDANDWQSFECITFVARQTGGGCKDPSIIDPGPDGSDLICRRAPGDFELQQNAMIAACEEQGKVANCNPDLQSCDCQDFYTGDDESLREMAIRERCAQMLVTEESGICGIGIRDIHFGLPPNREQVMPDELPSTIMP